MNTNVSDVHRTLAYRTDTVILQGVPSALMLCLLGLIGLTMDDGPPIQLVVASWVLVVTGIVWTAWALLRRSKPGTPVLVLSPAGILFRIPAVKEILIPWREVQGIDTIDITTWLWATRYPHQVTFRNVTVVLVSKPFYDRHIFIDSLFLRGPGWKNIFLSKGPSVQMALHHELLSVEPRALRESVETRWQAFRDQPASAPAGSPRSGSVPAIRPDAKPSVVTPAENVVSQPKPKPASAWDVAKIVLPLIGIVIVLAKMIGVWAMSQ